MSRSFAYFFYENFDAEQEAQNPQNPRRILGKGTDTLLSEVARHPAGEYSYFACCAQFGETPVQRLIDCGVLREREEKLFFDCPVFLEEDGEALRRGVAMEAGTMVELLEPALPRLYGCCRKLENGASQEENLYHILCGMVLDGSFFDYLNGIGIVATSRRHPSGLDYLTVIYEECEELRTLSDGLLCSYNRIANDLCALQSFGDAAGDRRDLYRYFRLMEQGRLPETFRREEDRLCRALGGMRQEELLREAHALLRTGECSPTALELLEGFGYAKNGKIAVPAYLPEHRETILEMEAIVEECLGEVMAGALLTLSEALPMTAVEHQVNRMEVANELYHILFGGMNEELVRRGYVAEPERVPGEGRYLKSMEVYQ